MRIIFPFVIFIVFINGVSLCEGEDGSGNQHKKSFSLSANNKNLTFEEIDLLVDELLKQRKNDKIDTSASSNDNLHLIYKKREENRIP